MDSEQVPQSRAAWIRYHVRMRFLLVLRSALIPNRIRVFCYRLLGARIGRGVKMDWGVVANFPRNLSIGVGAHVNHEVFIDCVFPVSIGDRALIGWRTTIVTGSHNISNPRAAIVGKPVVIGPDVWTGCQSLILPGVMIGSGAIVAAGSVVTKEIPADVVAGGNPARILKTKGGDNG